MFKSESLKELATALVAAQKIMPNAIVNAENSHFHNEYADLPAVREAILGPLNKHGIAIVQIPTIHSDGSFRLVTLLMHGPSGEYLGGEHPLPSTGTPQAMGSAITYARRQDSAGIVFIAADKDDDAEQAEGRQTKIIERAPPKPAVAAEFVKLAPQELPFDSDFLDWGTRLAAQLNAATSGPECDEWILKNQNVMATASKVAPAIVARLTKIATRTFAYTKVDQQTKKTEARKGTPANSAADDFDAYRLELLKANTDAALATVWQRWEATFKAHDKAALDKAVDMLETRRTATRKTAANVEHKEAA